MSSEKEWDEEYETPSCTACGRDATHSMQGRDDTAEATCGKCCNQCDEQGCDALYKYSAKISFDVLEIMAQNAEHANQLINELISKFANVTTRDLHWDNAEWDVSETAE